MMICLATGQGAFQRFHLSIPAVAMTSFVERWNLFYE
jgi:hypothetical protein